MKPLVSVCIITYNHEQYISMALDSVINQLTNFQFEIVIGEDCSVDNTKAIIMKYQKEYPNIIRAHFHSSNIGMMANFKHTLQACRGKYVALLEGDDYWIDCNKLEFQINYLEHNNEHVAVIHDCYILKNDCLIDQSQTVNVNMKSVLNTNDLFRIIESDGYCIPTASIVFRNSVIPEFPEELLKASAGDWPLYILLSLHGLFAYIPKAMSVYRIHSGGITLSKHFGHYEQQLSKLIIYDYFYKTLPSQFRGRCFNKVLALRYSLLKMSYLNNDLKQFQENLNICLINIKLFDVRKIMIILLFKLKKDNHYIFKLIKSLLKFFKIYNRIIRV